MIPYAEALALIRRRARLAPVEIVPLAEAFGRVAAASIEAAFPVPSFANSAMDGFALRHEDAANAAPERPVTLTVRAVTAAGEAPAALRPGEAVQIMTGAPMPEGADSVAPIEETTPIRSADAHVTAVTLERPVPPGQHVRRAGADFTQGEALAAPGHALGLGGVMALAASGVGSVAVRMRPVLTVFTTGNEVHDPGAVAPGALPPGAIFNVDGPALQTLARAAGLEVRMGGALPDEPAPFTAALGEALATPSTAPRIILSTGAVSKGDFDFVPQALEALGAETLFHRVAIKPGKPILFAVLPGGDYFFGLPGNPVSSVVGFRFFVTPLIRALLGLPEEKPFRARLENASTVKEGLRHFLKARLTHDPSGAVCATVLPGQESFRIKPLLQTQGWVAQAEDSPRLEPGALVPFFPLHPFSPL